MMNHSRAGAARLLSAIVLIAWTAAANGQHETYPNKPIRMIVPNPAGGGTDLMGRLAGQRLTERWGQQVIVDNRAGANGYIAGGALARSLPDGYTMMMATVTHVITPSLFPAPYDAVKDFAPVATFGKYEVVLVVHPSVPASTLKEFIAFAKSKPGQLNYGSPGSGSIPRLAGAFFDLITGTSMQNITYKGTSQMMPDLLGGQVQLSFSAPAAIIPFLPGKLKAIAVSGETRMAALPQVPTFIESGLALDLKSWQGLLTPAGTPKPIVEKISAEISRMLRMPEVREKIATYGSEPFFSTPEEFGALMKADAAKFARIISAANIKKD